MKIIADFPGQQAACDLCVLVDSVNDTVWVLYDHILDELRSPRPTQKKKRDIELHLIHSQDDGLRWSPPTKIKPAIQGTVWEDLMVAPGRGIQTENTHLIFPCYKNACAHLLVSEDGGQTWQLSADAWSQVGEAQVVELVDGSSMLNMRSYRGHHCRAVATTGNEGKTWQKVHDDLSLPELTCQASIIRYTDERDGFKKN